ncbi:gastrula zinc finger protein XlCGF7.1-like [Xyrauchen texanus]|uniref:gastrula zinc finger protein XlCGF7.1-like n=1 Tax=Xyrauchen texanus TaxID=154827 RepID=UPI002241F373|nr:gastrula zinc finger protein XlCGF7.1-like [Xyrauchen texanus]XP_051945885.1 gastrula zinc finger protein XlCGF7.1-like [Xyrauchen texanus]XP_051945886.1 gastrula zinc finger protein XlCGF7.1-like [Xyrauchen texanus]
MKHVIEREMPDCEQDHSSELTLEGTFVGVLGSEVTTKAPGPTKEGEEILVLSQVEESVGYFCHRLNYTKKYIQVSDESPSDTDTNTGPSVSPPSNRCETPGKKFSCKLCGVEYRRKANLVSHMRIHTGETPYCCELCGKAFRRSDWLKLHLNVHMGEKRQRAKRFVCDQCGVKFDCSAALQSHIWKHNGERPLSCPLCEKTFYSVVNLRSHQNDCHSEEKQFSCFVCGHSFARLHTLQKHTRIHTGEKPFSCSECGKSYRYKYSLLLHNKLHSDEG